MKAGGQPGVDRGWRQRGFLGLPGWGSYSGSRPPWVVVKTLPYYSAG